MKCFALFITLILALKAFSFETDKIDIENHPQSTFSPITINVNSQKVPYYGSSTGSQMEFAREEKELSGELALSGYIFSKEFMDSFKFPKTVANKKTKSEFVKVFSENNPAQMVEFLLQVNERKRTAQNEKEFNLISKLIKDQKTEDSPESTTYFSTGYIELKSPKNNNERYYIKLSDIDKSKIKLSTDKTKIQLLKSISVYAFQDTLDSLNFGDIEKNSAEDKLFQGMESVASSLCSYDCLTPAGKDLSPLALSLGKIVTFEVVGNSKISDMNDFNKYVLAQQWCILKEFTEGCASLELDLEVKKLLKNPVIDELVNKHKGQSSLCNFFQ